MSGSSAKNYLQSGDKWVIGGEIELVGEGVITKDGQPVIGGDGGGGVDIPDGSISTAKLADGAVTDAKLAKPKADLPQPLTAQTVLGTNFSGEYGLVGYSQEPMADQLVMYQFGGQVAVATPQADGDAASKEYVDSQVSGVTWATLSGKPATFAPTIGTTASTAAAGNHTHTASVISTTAITGVTGTNVQAVLAELAARIAALEGGG